MAQLIGQVIRGYELRALLGQGGFGAVYRAYQSVVEREVAIKIILPTYANEPEFIRRFEEEAQVVARLEHPHIVPLHDYWRDPSGAYLVMRWLRGGSVKRSLQEHAWTPEQTGLLLNQIASALGVAHRAGVIHRDIKTDNILLDEDRNAYLADFGIAKDLIKNPSISSVITGSPDYMSPEQLLGEVVTPQADIYSLGIVLFEMLTGKKPFKEPTFAAIMSKHLSEPVPSIRTVNPDLPASLDAVIARATRKKAAERYTTTQEMAAAYWQALNASSTSADVPSPAPKQHEAEGTIVVPAVQENPYKGLRAFQAADAGDFFGRDALIESMLKRLAGSGDASRFLAVVGPSGSGKSSVVKAGLIPALRKGRVAGSDGWFIVEMTPGAHPFEELELALLRVATQPIDSLAEQLAKHERGLLTAVKRLLPDAKSELLLVIDQFEELFTQLEDEGTRKRFLDNLLTAVTEPNSGLRVIVTLRGDFYDRPLLYADFGRLFRVGTEVVLPLNADELREAILSPAQRVGLKLEPGLVDAVVNDIGTQPGTLPLLQYALTELYNQRVGNLLTLKAYRESGGVMGALSRRAEQLYGDLDPAAQRVARQLFLRLVTPGEGAEDTRRRVRQDELLSLVGSEETIRTVIDRFGAYRLLTFDRDPVTRGPTVEVAHEALIRTWGTLRGWIDASRDDLRAQRLLMTAADEWQRSGFDASYIASGTRLAQFEEWAAATELSLSQHERNYLEASVAERTRLDAAKQATLEREHSLERRSRNRLRTLAAVLLVATIGALILSAFAFSQRQLATDNAATATNALGLEEHARATSVVLAADAQTQAALAARSAATATIAQGQALVEAENARLAEATAVRSADESQSLALASGSRQALSGAEFDLAVALALEANNISDPPVEASLALVDAASLSWSINRWQGHTDWVTAVSLDASGTRALSTSPDHTMILWNAATGAVIQQFQSGDVPIIDVTFLPDGAHAFAGYQDGRLAIWNLDTGAVEREWSGHESVVTSVAVNAEGTRALSASFDSTVKLWDLTTGDAIYTMQGHTLQALDVAFSPDEQTALSAGYDGQIILWDIASGEVIRTFDTNAIPVYAIAFSPDGQTALSAMSDGMVSLWDVSTGQIIRQMTGHDGEVTDVSFSPDGKTALSASQDTTVRLWDVDTGMSIRILRGHTALVGKVVFMPDGARAVSAARDNTLILWDVRNDEAVRQFVGHNGAVYSVVYSADGSQALSASGDSTLILWDVASVQVIRRFLGHTLYVNSAVFSPDGTQALSGSGDNSAILWDLATGRIVRRFEPEPASSITAVSFSPDGAAIVTGNNLGALILWDAQTGDEIRRFVGHTGAIYKAVFTPDGAQLLSASGDNTLILWDVASGTLLRTLNGHTNWVIGAAVSADGRMALSASADDSLILWNLETGALLHRFYGHAAAVNSVVFSPDDQTALSASDDGSLMLWDVQSGLPLRRFRGLPGAIASVAFSPDGLQALSASTDNTITLWNIAPYDGGLLQWARQNRYALVLTCEQRELYRIEPSCDANSALAPPTISP